MIDQITGRVTAKNGSSIVVETGGIGFRIDVPASLQRSLSIGDEIRLYVSMLFRNESFELFGFSSEEDRDFFNLLRAIPSIGPKTAFRIVSEIGVQGIREAVANRNPVALQRIPGIGKKTAQRILVELSEKLSTLEGLETSSPVVEDTVAALKQLGYSRNEIEEAIAACDLSSIASAEELLAKALEQLGKKHGG